MKPVCLVVIDGWGMSDLDRLKGDAIHHAQTPVMNHLAKTYPSTSIAAHGLAVGLPENLMGNSEVGHLNVGAGRVVFQDIVRIELCLKKRDWLNLPAFKAALERAKSGNGRLHLLGLVSDGGVHSHIRHALALIEECKQYGIKQCYLHFFADGRDTAPRSAVEYIRQVQQYIQNINYGTLATICGRYYAMDRDKRWERVEIAYNALVSGQGERTSDPLETVQERYAKDETDEFLKPIICYSGDSGHIKDDDTLIFFNFRSDRMRQITQVFGKVDGLFPFDVQVERHHLGITTMTQYKAEFPFPVLFPQQKMTNVLAEWLSAQKPAPIPQMHVAETEKYAHVTFFFNGGTEKQYPGEDREMIPSPKVATYDLKPDMSALEVGEAVAKQISTKKYPFVMCNFAPPDMVGHTGMFDAAVKAVEATDKAIGTIFDACQKHGYTLFITADHGNAEKMLADDGKTPHTAHTCARVPFIMTSTERKFRADLVVPGVGAPEGTTVKETGGALCDVAPTVLEYMGVAVPEDMTGESLLMH